MQNLEESSAEFSENWNMQHSQKLQISDPLYFCTLSIIQITCSHEKLSDSVGAKDLKPICVQHLAHKLNQIHKF